MNVDGLDGVDGAGSEAETSLRDDLRAAFEQHGAMEKADPADDGVAVEAAPSGEAADASGPADASNGQVRGTDGKFAKAEAAPADPNAAPAGDAAQLGAMSTDSAETGEAPGSWRAAAKEKWKDLPAEVRDEIAKRERDISRAVSNIDNERRFAREMGDVIRPHFETIKGFGVTPQFAVNALLNNDRLMRFGKPEEKIALARNFIRDYGIDPTQLIDPNAPTDPHVAQMQRDLEQLKAQRGVPQHFDHAPLPDLQNNGNALSDIETFRTDPAHPHFDQVAPQMATLLESGQATDLADAYAKAVQASPALRSTSQAQPDPAPQPVTQPIEMQRQSPAKAAAARHAGASVSRSPGPAGDPAPTSIRDELRENLRKSGFSFG